MAPLRLTRVRESYDALAGQLETSVQGVWEPHAQFDISDAGEVVLQCLREGRVLAGISAARGGVGVLSVNPTERIAFHLGVSDLGDGRTDEARLEVGRDTDVLRLDASLSKAKTAASLAVRTAPLTVTLHASTTAPPHAVLRAGAEGLLNGTTHVHLDWDTAAREEALLSLRVRRPEGDTAFGGYLSGAFLSAEARLDSASGASLTQLLVGREFMLGKKDDGPPAAA